MIKIKEIYEKIMKTKSLIILLILGVALLAMPGLQSGNKKTDTLKTSYNIDISRHQSDMEKKLSSMLSEIKEISDVSVMLTFADYGKFIYSQEEQSEKSENSQKGNTKPVLKNSSSGGEEPILIRAELPKISGVLVTAKGVSNPNVKNSIIDALKAVLDINAADISVLEK